jgi:hypothetical protein
MKLNIFDRSFALNNYLVGENQVQLLLHLFELQYYQLELVSHRFQLNELSNEHYLL